MFLSRNKKTYVYPCKPQLNCTKVGFKGVNIIYVCFRDVNYATVKTIYGRHTAQIPAVVKINRLFKEFDLESNKHINRTENLINKKVS